MIETYLLEQPAALAKYGTLSQPALSRSMKKLEQIIGVEFFVRKKKFPLPLMTKEFLPLNSLKKF